MRARSLTQLRGDKYQSMQLCQGKNIFFVTQRAASKENVAPGFHSGVGDVNPTVALQDDLI
jgi:hypothetical protein